MIAQIITRIDHLPPFPAIIAKVTEILKNDDYAVKEVVDVVKRDPALVANILKISNAAYFGPRQKITSIRDAVIFLGQRQLIKVLQTADIARYFRPGKRVYGADAMDLWEHSVAVAIMSQILSLHIRGREDDTLYTVALLHDIGKLVMGEYVEEAAEKIFQLVNNQGYSFLEAEEAVVGINHAELGGKIAAHWHFPEELRLAIAYHHRPDLIEDVDVELPFLVYLADQFCLMMGIDGGMDGLAHRGLAQVLKRYRLQEADLERSLVRLYEELDRAHELLQGRKDVGKG